MSYAAGYPLFVQTVWKGRLTQAATRYGELAPTATTCCNACRTCVQTNLLSAALAGIAAAGAFIARRMSHPS
jgi:hypothetical protein